MSLGMTTNTVEQAVPEATVRALLTQHALRVNCAVHAPCKVSSICAYIVLQSRALFTSFLPFFCYSFVRPCFMMISFVQCRPWALLADYFK